MQCACFLSRCLLEAKRNKRPFVNLGSFETIKMETKKKKHLVFFILHQRTKPKTFFVVVL